MVGDFAELNLVGLALSLKRNNVTLTCIGLCILRKNHLMGIPRTPFHPHQRQASQYSIHGRKRIPDDVYYPMVPWN